MADSTTDSIPRAGAVADRLRRIAAVEMRLAALQAELDQSLDAVRRRHDRKLSGLRRRMANLTEELESFCRENRDDILPAGRKTLKTTFGEVGFRKSEPEVAFHDGVTASDACSRLRRARLGRLVRTRHSIDKAAVRRAVAAGRVEADRLAGCGIFLADCPDSFRYKVRREPAEACVPGEGSQR